MERHICVLGEFGLRLEAGDSFANGVDGGQEVGQVALGQVGGIYHACLWAGTASSFVDLNPAELSGSEAKGANGGQQVGFAYVAGFYHASVWSGTAASWVDRPPGLSAYLYRQRSR